jgi:hypothetical protein
LFLQRGWVGLQAHQRLASQESSQGAAQEGKTNAINLMDKDVERSGMCTSVNCLRPCFKSTGPIRKTAVGRTRGGHSTAAIISVANAHHMILCPYPITRFVCSRLWRNQCGQGALGKVANSKHCSKPKVAKSSFETARWEPSGTLGHSNPTMDDASVTMEQD